MDKKITLAFELLNAGDEETRFDIHLKGNNKDGKRKFDQQHTGFLKSGERRVFNCLLVRHTQYHTWSD